MTYQELLKDERIEERRRIAKRMLEKGMDIEEIADCTALTKEQIIELKKEHGCIKPLVETCSKIGNN